DGIRDKLVTGVQTCALPIFPNMERRFMPDAQHKGEPFGICAMCLVHGLRERVGEKIFGRFRFDGDVSAKVIRFQLIAPMGFIERSEERRVGKEGKSRGWRNV